MIICEEGGRFSFEKKCGEKDHVICTNEEINGMKEMMMDSRGGIGDYVKPKLCKTVSSSEIKSSIFDTLVCEDTELLRLCRTMSMQKFQSEPVKPIHTAVRIIFHASSVLGRPYDVNMMATVLSISPQLVQQALKRWYKGLISQSDIREEHFIPTYLWILGLPINGPIRDTIVRAIKKYGDRYDGRSVFSIARDYTIIYFRLVLQLPFSCIPIDRIGIPSSFIQLISGFETRAKISRRKIFLRHDELNNDIALLFS